MASNYLRDLGSYLYNWVPPYLTDSGQATETAEAAGASSAEKEDEFQIVTFKFNPNALFEELGRVKKYVDTEDDKIVKDVKLQILQEKARTDDQQTETAYFQKLQKSIIKESKQHVAMTIGTYLKDSSEIGYILNSSLDEIWDKDNVNTQRDISRCNYRIKTKEGEIINLSEIDNKQLRAARFLEVLKKEISKLNGQEQQTLEILVKLNILLLNQGLFSDLTEKVIITYSRPDKNIMPRMEDINFVMDLENNISVASGTFILNGADIRDGSEIGVARIPVSIALCWDKEGGFIVEGCEKPQLSEHAQEKISRIFESFRGVL